MIYDVAMIGLLVAALFKRASLPFALVLGASMFANYTLIAFGELTAIWATDCVASSAVTALALRHRKWWSATCAAIVFLAVPLDQWYWTAWAVQTPGWDSTLWDQYKFLSCSLFAAAVLVVLLGDYDVPRVAREFLDWLGGATRSLAHDGGIVLRHGRSWAEKAPEGKVGPHGR